MHRGIDSLFCVEREILKCHKGRKVSNAGGNKGLRIALKKGINDMNSEFNQGDQVQMTARMKNDVNH